MGAIALQTHLVLRFSNNFSSLTNHPKLGKHASHRDVTFPVEDNRPRFTVFCTGSGDGNRRARPSRSSSSSASRRTPKKEDDDDGGEKPGVDKKPNSASQEDIIAIFRRIQSSISKEDSVAYDVAGSNVADKKSPASSILKILRESGKKQGKAKNVEGNKTMTRKRVVTKEEQRRQDYPPSIEPKLTRPLSKFVRRSPIPSPPTRRPVSFELNDGVSATAAETEKLKLPEVEEMKLVELKELAKSRGIKGYSKLKKSELISLLRSISSSFPVVVTS